MLLSLSPTELGTLYVLARGGSAARTEVMFSRPGGVIQSAAHLPGGDIVALAVGTDDTETILRFGKAGAGEVAQLPPAPASPLTAANPDAVAIGPHGEIGVIRMPSGSEPASLGDPALLILPGSSITGLAPWTTAVPADDPACLADDKAYRATIQTIGPWVRIAGRPFPDGALSGMTARVRWSPTRVCIEAVEIPESSGITPWSTTTETMVIASFAPRAAGRATIESGMEERTPLTCTLPPR